MRYLLLAVTFVLLNSLNTVFAADTNVMIHEPWVREAPPNAKMMAGYFSIMNMSKHDKSLVGASSPQFKKVELHRSIMEGDMMKMVAQKKVEIHAGQTVKFEPGSYHLMLMHPVKPLKAGDTVELTLKFSSGDTMKFNAPVKKGNGDHHMNEHMHMHMNM
jgi:copper(I)-binding protein